MSDIQILIGADPELFFADPATKKYVAAEGIIPGTKLEPFKVPRGAIQVDGFAAEFNIDPAASREEFIANVNAVRAALGAYRPDYKLVAAPTAKFDADYFDSQPAHTKELGCNPDWNAYTGRQNESPPDRHGIRTGAGHIHIGWASGLDPFDPVHMEDCRAIVKQLDYYVGIPSLLWDRDTERRKMYGAAGAFRPKSYGVEYRTPSNAWLRYGDDLMGWVYDRTKQAVVDLVSGKPPMINLHGNTARDLINGRYGTDAIRAQLKVMGLDYPDPSILTTRKAA